MNKLWRLLWFLALVPMTLTYGSMYSWAQHWSDGWLSHEQNVNHHLMAAEWALFPPMWIVAPIITSGYADGFQFRHHHTGFCRTSEEFMASADNKCELDPECDPVFRRDPCPEHGDILRGREPAKKETNG